MNHILLLSIKKTKNSHEVMLIILTKSTWNRLINNIVIVIWLLRDFYIYTRSLRSVFRLLSTSSSAFLLNSNLSSFFPFNNLTLKKNFLRLVSISLVFLGVLIVLLIILEVLVVLFLIFLFIIYIN